MSRGQAEIVHATRLLAERADATAAASETSSAALPAALAAFADLSAALVRDREVAWEEHWDREGALPSSTNDASLARMCALAAVENICFYLGRAAGVVDCVHPRRAKRD